VKRSVWAGRPRRGKGRGADRTKSGVERRIWKFIKGASTGEPSLAGFGGSLSAVGRAKEDSLSRGSQSRQVLATGRANGVKRDTRGPRCLVFQPERPGVKRSPICEGPDAQSERSETEHRSRSKWASKRNGRVFRLRDKLESGAA